MYVTQVLKSPNKLEESDGYLGTILYYITTNSCGSYLSLISKIDNLGSQLLPL